MSSEELIIDGQTVEDNPEMRQVEFEGDVGEERYQFAIQHAVLEALSGEVVDEENAMGIFTDFRANINAAALTALTRDADEDMVTVTESDIVEL